jgi:biotin transport system substrate-specific component
MEYSELRRIIRKNACYNARLFSGAFAKGATMTRANSNVLVDHFTREHSATLDVLWVVGFTLLTAALAQIRIQFPFTPVPLTGQTFGVLLGGAVLGSRRGFSSQALYLAVGAVGMPVFAGGGLSVAYLVGPTGGYLWSFPLAAALMGWLVERGASRESWRLALSLVLCDALILVSGGLWLHFIYGFNYRQAALLGFYPFLLGDIFKVVLLGLTLPTILNRSKPTGRA